MIAFTVNLYDEPIKVETTYKQNTFTKKECKRLIHKYKTEGFKVGTRISTNYTKDYGVIIGFRDINGEAITAWANAPALITVKNNSNYTSDFRREDLTLFEVDKTTGEIKC